MGDESSGCYAIVNRLGTKVQRGKGSKVFVEAHCCASPQRLVNLNLAILIAIESEVAKFFLP